MTDLLDRLKTAVADRYSIQQELGRGGMAVVYLAQDQKLNRQVALKVLRPELAASIGSERFLREIEIAASLNHPNILALYDCGEADGQLYYTMPFVEGETLRDRLDREKQLSSPSRTRWRSPGKSATPSVTPTRSALSTEISNRRTFCSLQVTQS
jgi:serine/threonine-protein kinase